MKNHSSKTLCQKLLSLVLTLAMLISMVSVPVFAASSISTATTDTASYYVKYYDDVSQGGDGLTYETAAADIETVVNYIAANHKAGERVTIYVDAPNDNTFTGVVGYAKNPHTNWGDQNIPTPHTATIRITSYNPSAISAIAPYRVFGEGSINHFPIAGPTILENIRLVGHLENSLREIVVNGNDLVIKSNVQFKYLSTGQTNLWTGYPYVSLGGSYIRYSAYPAGNDPDVTIERSLAGSKYVLGSTAPGGDSCYTSIPGDSTLRINGGAAKGVYTYFAGYASTPDANATPFTFEKNVNLVLDNSTTVEKFGYHGTMPTVNGAVQVIRNGGATIAEFDASTVNNAPVYDITVETGAKLDVTATAGKYNVIGDNAAYVVSADGKTITYSVNGVLTLSSAGAYTVKNAADVAAIKAANTPEIPAGKLFDGWTDNGNGTLTASFSDIPPVSHVEYFVKAGATANGDGTIAKPFADLQAAVSAVKKAITAETGTATLYILPNGTEKERHNPFDDVADGTYLSLQTINSSTYAHPNITITYKSYNGEYEGKVANRFTGDHRGSIANFTAATFYGFPFLISGPTVFEDIVLLDMRQQGQNPIYANNFDVKIGQNVTIYHAIGQTKDKETGIVSGTNPNGNTEGQRENNGSYFQITSRRFYTGANASYKNVYNTTAPRIEYTSVVPSDTAGTSGLDFIFGNTVHSALPGATIVLPKTRITIVSLTTSNSLDADEIFTGPLNIVLNGTNVALFRVGEDVSDDSSTHPVITSTNAHYGVQIIKNNGANIPSRDYIQCDIYDITAENVAGFGLDVTDTVGTYAVKGGVAYTVSADGKTITYSANNRISVAGPGAYTFKYAADLDALKSANTPEAPEGKVFEAWEDNGNGTLTAKFIDVTDVALPDTFYAMYGGIGDGSTPKKASGDLKTLIQNIDKAYGAGKEVTILLMRNDAEEAKLPFVKDAAGNDTTERQLVFGSPYDPAVRPTAAANPVSAPYLAYTQVPAHKTKIIFKSYNVNDKTNLAFTNKYDFGANDNINVVGPVVFDNLHLFDNNIYVAYDSNTGVHTPSKGYAREMYAQEFDVKFVATDIVRIDHDTYGKRSGTQKINVSGGIRTWHVTGGAAAFTIEINDIATLNPDAIGLTGFIGNTEQDNKTVTVMDGDATLILNGTGDTIATLKVDKSHADRPTTFKGNANIVLNNVVVANEKFTSTSNTVLLENGALNIIRNNGAVANADAITASNGKKYDLTVEKDVTLMPMSEVGKFAVTGTKLAYVVAGEKIYYSVNGVLTIPTPGKYTVKNAADVAAIKAANGTGALTFGQLSDGWVEASEGVLETTITTLDTFYARYGADVNANGYSVETASGSLQNLVNKIEASGNYGEGKTVTIKVIRNDTDIVDANTPLATTDGSTVSHKFLYYNGITAKHKTKIVYTSADENNKSIIAYTKTSVDGVYGAHIYISGPTEFKNITLFDNNVAPIGTPNFYLDIYANEFDVKVSDIDVIRMYNADAGDKKLYPRIKVNEDGTTTNAFGTLKVNGGAYAGTGGISWVNTDGFTIEIDSPAASSITGLNLGGYGNSDNEHQQNIANIEGDAIYKLGEGNVTVTLNNSNNSTGAQFFGSINLVLNGTSATFNKGTAASANNAILAKPNTTYEYIRVDGAFQVVKNNGATIKDLNKLVMKNENGKVTPVYVITTNGVKLDVTETVGVYKAVDGNIPYLIDDDGETITYFKDGVIALDEGEHTVYGAATIADIMKANAPEDSTGRFFSGWTDNKKGTLTANFAAERTAYYVQYGATGNGYTELSPSGDIKAVIEYIEKSGFYGAGKNVTIYFMHSPEEEKLPFIKDADGNDTEDRQIIDIDTTDTTNEYTVPYIAYSAVPAHKTKITYTSYNVNDKTYFAFLPTTKMKDAAANINIKGPTVFDNITLYDNNMHAASYRREIYCGEYDTKFVNTNVIATNHTTLGVRDPNAYANYTNIRGGLRSGSGGSGDYTIEIVKFSDLFQRHDELTLGLSGLTTGASTQVTEIDGNATFIVTGDGETIPKFHVDASSYNDKTGETFPTTFKKNANIVLNNVKVTKLTNNSYLGTTVVNVGGALNIILNDGASITTDEVTVANGNKFVLTVDSGIRLMPTAEVGKFQVVGNNVAYVVSEDGKTVTYSVGGIITLAPGSYTVKNAATLDQIKANVRAEDTDTQSFTGWADNNAGTLTAQFTSSTTKYYIVYGGTGNGRSYADAAGDFTTIINNINADGHGAASEVTVYVDHHPEKFENVLGWLTSDTPGTGLPYHAATIRFTTYNYDKTADNKSSIALFRRPAATEPLTYGHLFAINGPTIFENIALISHFTGNARDIIANGHDVQLINIEFKSHNSNLEIYTCAPEIRLGGNSSAYGTKGDGSEFIIDAQSINNFTKGVSITFSTNMAYTTSPYNSFENDATLRLNGGTVTYVYTAAANSGAEEAVFTFNKNLNLVLNNGTVVSNFGYLRAMPTVNGAIQIIRNGGSTINALDTSTRNDAPVYNIASVGADLDITETAGTFKVPAGKYAYTTYEKGVNEIVYYGTGTITVPAGAYTVKYADSLAAVKNALGKLADDFDNGLVFDSWVVDEAKQQITAKFVARTPNEKAYYVIAGGRGDKSGSSPENAAVSVQSLVAQINKDLPYKGDIARVYIMQVEGCPENNNGLFSKFVENASTYAESTFTPWVIHSSNSNIIPPENHLATMYVTTYNYAGTNNYLAYSNFIGTNHKLYLSGPTVFENISLVRPRQTDREIVFSGFSVEFKEGTRFYDTNADFHGGTPYNTLRERNPNFWAMDTYTMKQMSAPQSIKFGSSVNVTTDNYGNHTISILGGHTHENDVISNYPVSYYFDHSDLMALIGFGYLTKSESQKTTTVNAGLNLIYNQAKTLEFHVGDLSNVNAGKHVAPVDIKGGLQLVNNNGNKFPEIPSNVTYDKLWVVNSAANAGGTLDVTDVAGTFKVLGGKVAYAQSADKKTIYYGNETITLPAGEYEIFYAADVAEVMAMAEIPADTDAYNVFEKWVDNGDGTMTAQYMVQIPTCYVDSANGLDTNDGKTATTAFKTIAHAVQAAETAGTNMVVYVIGEAAYENVPAHTVTIYYASHNAGVLTAADSTISAMGPSTFDVDFASAMTVITNGYEFALGGAVDTTKPVKLVLGENDAQVENLALSGKYIDEIVYYANTCKTNITIDGAIVRRFVSGALNTANYVVDDIKITVNSGHLYAYDHADSSNHHTEATFELVFNANTFYFDAVQYDENTTLTQFTTFLATETYPKIQYAEGGMYVIRSADNANFLVPTDVAGVYTFNGKKVAYSISDNGQNIYYPIDGKIKLPAGTPVVSWINKFSANSMPAPTLPAGYKFEGWKDDENGLLTAQIIKPIVFYVDSKGDDNAAGTLAAPYKTIGKAMETLGAASGTIYVVDSCDFDLTKAPANRTNNVIIKGYDADSVINVAGDITVNGNIAFENIKLNGIGNVTFAGGKLEFGEGVVIASTVNVVAGSASTGVYDKVVLSNGTYTVKTASNVYVRDDATADITVDSANAGAEIKINNYGNANVSFANTNYANAQIINNNGTLNLGAIAQNTWVINSTLSDLRVNFSDTLGTYDITAPYGKIPVAVATDGTVYVANKAEADLERPATWYETNEYAPYTYYRRPLTNTYKLLTEGKEQVDIVYFGGSLTAGYGASDAEKTSWRALMMQWFAQNFPNANIKHHKMTLGETGTFMGTYRVTENIIPCQPDLLIIEYAINDTYNDNYNNDADFGYHAGLQFETIVREVRQAYPDCDIVALYTSDANRIAQHREPMELHSTAAAHDRIAQAYDIPAILVGPSLANRLKGDTLDQWREDYYNTYVYNNDGVHLNDTGNYEYFKHVREFFNNELFGTDHGDEVLRTEIPAVISDHLLDGNRTVYHMTDELLAKSEALGGSGFTAVHNYYIHQFYGGSYTALRATSKDAVFAMEFDGTALDIVSNFQSGTAYLVSLDGGEYKEYSPSNNRPYKLFENLPKAEGRTDNKHVVRIKPLVFRSDVDYIELLALMSNDADLHTRAGATYEHKDITKYSLTVPAGEYELYYVDAGTTIADLAFDAADDSLIITGWTDGENAVDASAAVTAGSVYAPATVDVNEYLGFAGVQVRPYISEQYKQGLRFVADKNKAVDSVVNLTNFGMVLIPSKFIGDTRTHEDYTPAGGNSTNNIIGSDDLYVGSKHTYNGKTYSSADVVAEKIFNDYGTGVHYTTVLTGITEADYATLYTAKAYVRYTFNGKEYLAYSDAFRSSMYEVASFALDTDGETLNANDKALLEEIVDDVLNN